MKRFDKDVDINEKIIELKLAMKNTNNLRLYKRYSVVLKHLQGFKNKDITEMECLEKHTVGIYIKNYIDRLNELEINLNTSIVLVRKENFQKIKRLN